MPERTTHSRSSAGLLEPPVFVRELGDAVGRLREEGVPEVVRAGLGRLTSSPHVTRVDLERTSHGWELYVLVDVWTVAVVKAISAELGPLYAALADQTPCVILDDHIWQQDEYPAERGGNQLLSR